jgi:hypothetical protein
MIGRGVAIILPTADLRSRQNKFPIPVNRTAVAALLKENAIFHNDRSHSMELKLCVISASLLIFTWPPLSPNRAIE